MRTAHHITLQLLIALDMALNFRVARYKHGQLVTCKRTLALDYLRGYFTIDLLSGGPDGAERAQRASCGSAQLRSCWRGARE